MRRCSKTGQYLSPSAWAFEIVQPVDFTRHLSGKCRLSAQSGVEVHRLRSFLFGQGIRPIRQVPFIIPMTGLIRSPCRPVRRAGDAGPLKGHGRPKKKGDPKTAHSLFRWQNWLEVHAARPARWRRRTTQGAWAANEKGRSEDRPFIIPVTELIRSPCRPCRRPALPASERPSSEARRSWLRW